MVDVTPEQTGDQAAAGAEQQGGEAGGKSGSAVDVKAIQSDLEGVRRVVDELQRGKQNRLPQWIKDAYGVESPDELRQLVRPKAAEPDKSGEAGQKPAIRVPRSESGKPIRPRRSDFVDPDTGLEDVARYDDAMDAYEQSHEAWLSSRAAEDQESEAIDRAIAAAPAHLAPGENGKEILADILGVLAWKEAGEKTAQPEHIQAALAKYSSHIEESVKARLAEIESQAKANTAKEPRDLGALSGGKASTESWKEGESLLDRNRRLLSQR